jgi:hypothetical protein
MKQLLKKLPSNRGEDSNNPTVSGVKCIINKKAGFALPLSNTRYGYNNLMNCN